MEQSNIEDSKVNPASIVTYRGPSKLQRTQAMKGSKYFITTFRMNQLKESFVDLDGKFKLLSFTSNQLQLARSNKDTCMEITLMCHDIENAYCFGDTSKSVELAEAAWQCFNSLQQTAGSPNLPFLLAKLATYSAQAYIATKQFGRAEDYLELATTTLSQTEVCDDSMWTLFTIGQYHRDFLFSSPNMLTTTRQKAIDSYHQSFCHYQELDQAGRETFYPEAVDCLLNIARIHLDSPDLPFGRSRTGVVTSEDIDKAAELLKKAEQMLTQQSPKTRRFRQFIRLQLCQGGLYYRRAELLYGKASTSHMTEVTQKEDLKKARMAFKLAVVYVEEVHHQASSTTFSEKKRSEEFLSYLKSYPPHKKYRHCETEDAFPNRNLNVDSHGREDRSRISGDSSLDSDVL